MSSVRSREPLDQIISTIHTLIFLLLLGNVRPRQSFNEAFGIGVAKITVLSQVSLLYGKYKGQSHEPKGLLRTYAILYRGG